MLHLIDLTYFDSKHLTQLSLPWQLSWRSCFQLFHSSLNSLKSDEADVASEKAEGMQAESYIQAASSERHDNPNDTCQFNVCFQIRGWHFWGLPVFKGSSDELPFQTGRPQQFKATKGLSGSEWWPRFIEAREETFQRITVNRGKHPQTEISIIFSANLTMIFHTFKSIFRLLRMNTSRILTELVFQLILFSNQDTREAWSCCTKRWPPVSMPKRPGGSGIRGGREGTGSSWEGWTTHSRRSWDSKDYKKYQKVHENQSINLQGLSKL